MQSSAQAVRRDIPVADPEERSITASVHRGSRLFGLKRDADSAEPALWVEILNRNPIQRQRELILRVASRNARPESRPRSPDILEVSQVPSIRQNPRSVTSTGHIGH
jgi:hypothetical protein